MPRSSDLGFFLAPQIPTNPESKDAKHSTRFEVSMVQGMGIQTPLFATWAQPLGSSRFAEQSAFFWIRSSIRPGGRTPLTSGRLREQYVEPLRQTCFLVTAAVRFRIRIGERSQLVRQDSHGRFPRKVDGIRRKRQFPAIRILAAENPTLDGGTLLRAGAGSVNGRKLTDADLGPALVALYLNFLHFEMIEGHKRRVQLENVPCQESVGRLLKSLEKRAVHLIGLRSNGLDNQDAGDGRDRWRRSFGAGVRIILLPGVFRNSRFGLGGNPLRGASVLETGWLQTRRTV